MIAHTAASLAILALGVTGLQIGGTATDHSGLAAEETDFAQDEAFFAQDEAFYAQDEAFYAQDEAFYAQDEAFYAQDEAFFLQDESLFAQVEEEEDEEMEALFAQDEALLAQNAQCDAECQKYLKFKPHSCLKKNHAVDMFLYREVNKRKKHRKDKKENQQWNNQVRRCIYELEKQIVLNQNKKKVNAAKIAGRVCPSNRGKQWGDSIGRATARYANQRKGNTINAQCFRKEEQAKQAAIKAAKKKAQEAKQKAAEQAKAKAAEQAEKDKAEKLEKQCQKHNYEMTMKEYEECSCIEKQELQESYRAHAEKMGKTEAYETFTGYINNVKEFIHKDKLDSNVPGALEDLKTCLQAFISQGCDWESDYVQPDSYQTKMYGWYPQMECERKIIKWNESGNTIEMWKNNTKSYEGGEDWTTATPWQEHFLGWYCGDRDTYTPQKKVHPARARIAC